EADDAGGQRRSIQRVVSAEGLDCQLVGGFGARDGDDGRQTGDRDIAAIPGNSDVVGVIRASDDHGVNGPVSGAAARGTGQIDVDSLDVGGRQVVARDSVVATEGGEVHLLGAVHVHRDGADVAREAQARAVCGKFKFLSVVGAVELQRVISVLALDDV